MSRPLAWRLKNLSVYVGVVGYLAMILSGDVILGVYSKLAAEALRIPFYKRTDAKDMVRLSWFFIIASTISIFKHHA